MKDATLEGLFLEHLKDIYYAERKILKTLPKMARAAQSADLKTAFEAHHAQTETHIERLQQVFELMGKRATAKTCPAIDGIVEEGEETIDAFKGKPALDAGLIAAAQAVEHYEMARYGTLKCWADTLGMRDASDLLAKTLDEETTTDESLTKLAKGSVNKAALREAA